MGHGVVSGGQGLEVEGGRHASGEGSMIGSISSPRPTHPKLATP